MKKLLLAAMAVMILGACTKEVSGPMGPQGPQGEQGNANVSSTTFTTTSASWIGSNATGWETDYFWGGITPEIVNEGVVLVYFVSGQQQAALPLTVPGANSQFVFVGFSFENYGISVGYVPSSGAAVTNPGVKTFKIVAIAPKALQQGPEAVQKMIDEELRR